MALELVTGFLPEHNDGLLYKPIQTDFTFLTATTQDGVAPPQGTRWLGGSGRTSVLQSITAKAYQRVLVRAHRVEASPGAGAAAGRMAFYDSGNNVLAVGAVESNGKIKYRFTAAASVVATGTTEYPLSANHTLIWLLDGTNWTLYVDGVSELVYATAIKIQKRRIEVTEAGGSAKGYWRGCVLIQSDTAADLDLGSLVGGDHSSGASDWATEQEYGNNGNCGAGSTAGTYTDVQLDGSDQVSTASFWCEVSAESGKQMSELDNPTVPAGATSLGVICRSCQALSAANKTLVTYQRLHDGTNALEIQNESLVVTAWEGRQQVFATAPDAGAWNPTKYNSLKAGLRRVSGEPTNDHCAAFEVEFYWIEAPPAGTADRRRLLAQVS